MRRRVLILCTGNSVRSQIAEGLINHFLAADWQAFSAGIKPAGYVHPLAIQVMSELGIDIAAQQSKSVDVYRGEAFDLVITVCDDAAENCPLWLGRGRMMHVGLPDPAAAQGSMEERLQAFRQVRDAIRERILLLLKEFSP